MGNTMRNGKKTEPAAVKTAPGGHHDVHHATPTAMALLALGVVFGDIGTSPLYAFQVALKATGTSTPDQTTVYGIASLIIWSLVLTIWIKYNKLVLRADNGGEGGILALISLVKPDSWATGAGLGVLGLLGIIGAAFIFGDGTITPAISVLSAMEGMELLPAFTVPSFVPLIGNTLVTPHLDLYSIIPMTLGVLIGLFAMQKGGTKKIGKLFGPIMFVWFITIFLVGAVAIFQHPGVLAALNPLYAFWMLENNQLVAAAIFGAVFLALTGGEAMYADMGHVGAKSIRQSFMIVVLPALVFNYLGQAATVVADVSTIGNPFYKAAPSFALVPMIAIATLATIIASQALITGTFSLTKQAIQMSLLPRMKVTQTSDDAIGQIYIPVVNWLLMAGTILIVLVFRSSDALAAAYGIAVSGTMLITTILLYSVMVYRWQWKPLVAGAVVSVFGTIDLGFFLSNSMKVLEGGYVPLVIAAFITFIMVAFRAGSWADRRELNDRASPLEDFLARIDRNQPVPNSINVKRIEGETGVFLTKVFEGVTPFLKHYAKSTGSLPAHVILCSIETLMVPRVEEHDPRRVEYVNLSQGFSRVVIRHGFMQIPLIEDALKTVLSEEEVRDLHYFVGHDMVTRKRTGSRISRLFFVPFMILKNLSSRSSDFFQLQDEKVMEVGLHISI
jgi:KUP system potassium uptake protein